MFALLQEIYGRAEEECIIGVAFRKGDNGEQANLCRTMLIEYVAAPDVEKGRALAERLAGYTTKRSGLGLLFLIKGQEGQDHKVVLSRFRANNGVLVNEGAEELTVEFIDRVFMKNAHSYKAVSYRHASLAGGFWTGFAVDKQINSRDLETSDYWVKDFLASEFQTTPAAGTRRLALALKDAIQGATDLEVKQQITAAVTLAGGLDGQAINAGEFCERFGFDDVTTQAVKKAFKRADLVADNFVFSSEEFTRQLPYRSVELDSGAVLMAEADKFEEIFQHEPAAAHGDRMRFSTEGKIVTEKLTKTK